MLHRRVRRVVVKGHGSRRSPPNPAVRLLPAKHPPIQRITEIPAVCVLLNTCTDVAVAAGKEGEPKSISLDGQVQLVAFLVFEVRPI